MITQILPIIPEILLGSIAIIMQVVAVFIRNNYYKELLFNTGLLALGAILVLLRLIPDYEVSFTNSFIVSKSLSLFKEIVFTFSAISIIIYKDLVIISGQKLKMEFVTLVLLSTLGVFISISARDCILFFCGLELQALCGYAIAAFNTKNVKSSEAGLKYFILGALMSCVMLLGISFLYGFSGSIKFIEIKSALTQEPNIGLIIGSILLIAPLLFKLSAAPLHAWTPDVYEGAPISAVSYFATAQKFGALVVLIIIIDKVISDYDFITHDLIKIVAIFSMIIGSLGAIIQFNIKRMMAYSTILNVGYVLIGLSLPSLEGRDSALLYMLIYAISCLGFFACLVILLGARSDEATFVDLSGIAKKRKVLAATMSILMFSMIGLPPLAGFFGKYYIFYNAILSGEIMLAVVGVLTSVIAAFYYLKVIKFMYFMESTKEILHLPRARGIMAIISLSLISNLFFFTVEYIFIQVKY